MSSDGWRIPDMFPGWYNDFFLGWEHRDVDPFGYGVGLAIGYVIIPLIILTYIVMIWHWIFMAEHDQRK